MRGKPWAEYDDMLIVEKWSTTDDETLANALGRTVRAMQERAYRLKMPRRTIVKQGAKREKMKIAGNWVKHDYKSRPERERLIWREFVSAVMSCIDEARKAGRVAHMVDAALDGLRKGVMN
jgi:hypothetical protein